MLQPCCSLYMQSLNALEENAARILLPEVQTGWKQVICNSMADPQVMKADVCMHALGWSQGRPPGEGQRVQLPGVRSRRPSDHHQQ